jgi:dihydrofolate reductase
VARVVYGMGVSLDGYVEDPDGGFGWSAPDPEVHRIANVEVRDAAALLYGRRMYELMESFWPQAARRDDLPEVEAEFARAYVATPRIVFSDTLDRVGEGARLVRRADAVAEVRRLKAEAEGELGLGGAALAASLFDLIDEFRLWVSPVAVGGGTPFFPAGRPAVALRHAGTTTTSSGQVVLRYERVR